MSKGAFYIYIGQKVRSRLALQNGMQENTYIVLLKHARLKLADQKI